MTSREPAELDELSDRHAEPDRRRRRRWPWVLGALATVVVVALVLVALYAGALARSYDDNRRTVSAPNVTDGEGGAVTVLLLGSDSRGEEGSPDVEGERSDTMMVVHIPEDRSGVYVMSILRDLYVDIPGHGKGKINSALAKGGYELTVDTVEELLDIEVNHLVEIDFQGFRGVTEALGGVSVCNPTAFSSGVRNPSYFPRGEILLQDTAALRYVRERHAFARGDLTRVENQQRVVFGALDRFLSVDVLADPRRTMDVVSTLSRHLTVDEGLDSRRVAGYGWDLRSIGSDDVEMFTIPNAGGAVEESGQQVVLPDEQQLDRLKAAYARDDLGGYLREVEREEKEAAERRRAERRASESAAPSSSDGASSPAPATPAPVPAVEDPCG
ncbi:LCP family protein [Micrococcus lylae]|uniref:LCP family protein n=1 Tax=Micrococcus lylae TaxID=1273 RepID=UPI000A424049|nr:LCP family protein [Micrococcus lylae]